MIDLNLEDVDRYSLALYYFVDETRYTEEGHMVRFYKDSVQCERLQPKGKKFDGTLWFDEGF